jgi:hypothetical protein
VPQLAQDEDQSHVPPWRVDLVDHPRLTAPLAPDGQEPAREGPEGQR